MLKMMWIQRRIERLVVLFMVGRGEWWNGCCGRDRGRSFHSMTGEGGLFRHFDDFFLLG